jgi:hypothetical protein
MADRKQRKAQKVQAKISKRADQLAQHQANKMQERLTRDPVAQTSNGNEKESTIPQAAAKCPKHLRHLKSKEMASTGEFDAYV